MLALVEVWKTESRARGRSRAGGRRGHRLSRRPRASGAHRAAPTPEEPRRAPHAEAGRRWISTPYLEAWRTHHGKNALSMSTMRGCPYSCRWCSRAVYGESYRRRSPRLVVDGIEEVVARYRPDTLWFVDDVFTINHRWLQAFTEELERRGGAGALRVHHARRPTGRARHRPAQAFGLLSRVDRRGERVAEDPGRHRSPGHRASRSAT